MNMKQLRKHLDNEKNEEKKGLQLEIIKKKTAKLRLSSTQVPSIFMR